MSRRSKSKRVSAAKPRRAVKASPGKTASPKKASPKKASPKKAAPKRTASKQIEAPPRKVAAKPGAKAPPGGPAPLSPKALLTADKLESLDSLFVRESGADQYAIFGARGPILWGKGLALGKADLALWREALGDPEAHDGATWRFEHAGEAYTYTLSSTRDVEVPGHGVALSKDEVQADDDDENANRSGPLCVVGARYGSLFMVFAGSPNDFADGDFQSIHDVLRACGAAG
jgi:hypothetical protein